MFQRGVCLGVVNMHHKYTFKRTNQTTSSNFGYNILSSQHRCGYCVFDQSMSCLLKTIRKINKQKTYINTSKWTQSLKCAYICLSQRAHCLRKYNITSFMDCATCRSYRCLSLFEYHIETTQGLLQNQNKSALYNMPSTKVISRCHVWLTSHACQVSLCYYIFTFNLNNCHQK